MTMTAGQKLTNEVSALVRARNTLLWIVTSEEARVERALTEMAAQNLYEVRIWDIVSGVTDGKGAPAAPGKDARQPSQVLSAIALPPKDSQGAAASRSIWILRDFDPFLTDPSVRRALKTLARTLPQKPRNEARTVIVLTTKPEVPPDLVDYVVVVRWELPDRIEIGAVFDAVIAGLAATAPEAAGAARAVREAAVEAAVGLTAEQAASCYSKSLVTQAKAIDPAVVSAEKRRIVSKIKGLEWYDPDPRGLAAVGGLENLKSWLQQRRAAFSERARAFGLPLPRGLLLVGLPGGGKSLCAKAVASAWSIPLLRLDMGGAKSKYVGESEANLRGALAVADAVGSCVLFIEELDKAISPSGSLDGGVSQDALGTLLTWMQDRKGAAFIVATANDVRALPPELLRKGRFDEIFWVDLPTQKERIEILRVTLRQLNRDGVGIDLDAVAHACDGFVGAEIAAIVPDALFVAFADNEREISTADLIIAAATVAPLARTAAEKVGALRDWARGRARMASLPEEMPTTASGGRSLDLDT